MKILHTADWHAGLISWKNSKRTERNDEIEMVLDQILEIAKTEDVDLVLVAGDVVHDRNSPNLRTLEIVLKALKGLSEIAPTVLVLGNHDWEGLLTYGKLIENLWVIGFGDFRRLDIDTNAGKVSVYTLPYVSGGMGLLHGMNKVKQVLADKLNSFASEEPPTDYKVLVGHAMVEGVINIPEENKISLILEKKNFGGNFDYVALGHVHSHLVIQDLPKTVYSGSIFQLNFGEEDENKGFVIAEIGERTDVRFVKVDHKKLKTVDARNLDGSEIFRKVEEALDDFDYVRVRIRRKNADIVPKLMDVEGVVQVLTEEEISEVSVTFSDSESPVSVLRAYVEENLKSKLEDERLVGRGMEIFDEAVRRITTA